MHDVKSGFTKDGYIMNIIEREVYTRFSKLQEFALFLQFKSPDSVHQGNNTILTITL